MATKDDRIAALEAELSALGAAAEKAAERIVQLGATVDRQAKDIAAQKDRNRKVIKARTDAIANRDDALADVARVQKVIAEGGE
jgi:cell division protein FtsB